MLCMIGLALMSQQHRRTHAQCTGGIESEDPRVWHEVLNPRAVSQRLGLALCRQPLKLCWVFLSSGGS